MKNKQKTSRKKRTIGEGGQSVVEIIVAIAVFSLIAFVIFVLASESYVTTRYGKDYSEGTALVNECLEAVKSIRDRSWLNLINGDHGLSDAAGYWELSGTSEIIGKYTRAAAIEDAYRDIGGDIAPAGAMDPRTKKATCAVNWDFEAGKPMQLSAVTYLTDWNVFDWTETTDVNFNAGAFFDTSVQDIGEAADIILTPSTGQQYTYWVPSGGTEWFETTDLEFGAGTFNQTTVVGADEDASIVLAEATIWRNYDSPTFSNLNDIYMLATDNAWAVGTNGRITNWDGTAWSTFTSPTNSTLNAVRMVSSTDGWAVGASGRILRWNGTAWSVQASPTSETLNEIYMLSGNAGWAVGDKGTILRWNGSTWSTQSSPTNRDLMSVHMLSTADGWAVGRQGKILRWSGTSWSEVSSPTNRDLMSVHMLSTADGWAVGNSGTFLRWNGSSWTSESSPTMQNMASVYFINDEDGWAVGAGGTILRFYPGSYDTGTFISKVFDSGKAGTTWDYIFWTEDQPLGTQVTASTRSGPTSSPGPSWSSWSAALDNPWGNELSSPNNRYFQYRLTLSTTDPLYTVTVEDVTVVYDKAATEDLYGLHMLSTTEGWIVGDDGRIIYYDGVEWEPFTSPVTKDLGSVYMTTSTEGWAVGQGGTILRYNGSVWSDEASPTNRTLNGVHMITGTDGWAVGDNGTAIHWDGAFWTDVSTPTSKDLESVYMVASNDVWAVGGNGGIIHWTGTAWSAESSPTTHRLYDVDFTDANNGKAVGASGEIISWNGTSWAHEAAPTAKDWLTIDISLGTQGWAMGTLGVLGFWDGADWHAFENTPTERDLNETDILGEDEGWGCGEEGVILQLTRKRAGYPETGQFVSQVLDSGSTITDWIMAVWHESIDAGNTDITVATRGGNTAIPDITWSAWSAEMTDPDGSLVTTPDSQYLQYRATLSTADTTSTPEFHDITITYRQ